MDFESTGGKKEKLSAADVRRGIEKARTAEEVISSLENSRADIPYSDTENISSNPPERAANIARSFADALKNNNKNAIHDLSDEGLPEYVKEKLFALQRAEEISGMSEEEIDQAIQSELDEAQSLESVATVALRYADISGQFPGNMPSGKISAKRTAEAIREGYETISDTRLQKAVLRIKEGLAQAA